MNNSIIPLFPLSLVVFPESKYPLHIFEERYKRMLRRCRSNGEGFGIAAQIGTDISKVGTYVKVSEILKEYESGESDIIVHGTNRIVILEYHLNPDGYYEALVENYGDITESIINDSAVEELKDKFKEIVGKVNFKLEDAFWNNYLKNANKSFKIAEKSGLSISQQQKLLTLQDENERVNYLLNHFEKLEGQIEKSSALKEIILSDGYINN
ncbi:MAG TPA: LON peptidase substrate-binding domain-containing protein [Ignavibacteriaceae bacterium]|nr:LON peptidase substrate-binding domain-containing protein [Ignavibacteriaceae bacterium]